MLDRARPRRYFHPNPWKESFRRASRARGGLPFAFVDGAPQPPVRLTTAGMRGVFFVGSGLVTLAGLQLFVGTDHTDRYFAWTIQVPLTAAFLGAFYLTALFLALPSGLAGVWARARVGVCRAPKAIAEAMTDVTTRNGRSGSRARLCKGCTS